MSGSMKEFLCPNVRKVWKGLESRFSIFIHITEDFLHLRVADGLVEVDRLDARRVDESKQRQHQQQSAEARDLCWKLSTTMLGEHHLSEKGDSSLSSDYKSRINYLRLVL